MHYFVKSKHLFIGDSKETIEGILEIKDGKIAAILPYHEEVDGEIIDTGDQMVTPGFIDAHVHLYLSSLIHLGKMKAVGATSIEEVVAQAKEIPVYNGWIDENSAELCHNVDEFVESLRKVLDGKVDKREAGYRVAESRSIDDVALQLVKAYQTVLEM